MTSGSGVEKLHLEIVFNQPGVRVVVYRGWYRVFVWGRYFMRSHWDSVHPDRRDSDMRKLLDSLSKRVADSVRGGDVVDPAGWEAYPLLLELMGTFSDGSGKERVPASLTIFAGDGVFKACLHERQNCLKLWASSSSLTGVLEALETRLSDPEIDWRACPPDPSTKKWKQSGK